MKLTPLLARPGLALLCLALATPLVRADPPVVANQLTLSASATAEISNDVLVITFSTQREGADPAALQAQLTQALNAALAEARKAARPQQLEVRTGNFSMYPRYSQKGGINGWQGSAEMTVEGRDMPAIAQLAGRIQTMTIARVSYALSREAREKVEGEVSTQAIARFRSQAEGHAKAFGFGSVTLRAVEVSTNASSGPPMPRFRAASAEMAMAAAPLPVQAGTSEVSVVVSGSVQMQK